MSFRVIVADKLPAEGLAAFDNYDAVDLNDRSGIERSELIEILGEYDGLVVRSRTKADAEMISAGGKLKVIGRAGIGVDNIDLAAATRAGIVVMNTPDGNAITTAEHTISLMLSVARWIPQATASMKAGKWDKKKFTGRELCGKTLGIIGLGNIGRIVADRAQGLHMKVIGFDPYFEASAAAKLGIEVAGFDQLLGRADIITVHAPLNDETRGLIGDAQIDAMKPGVILVNCARGGIYDEDALLRGVRSGKVSGVALDVYSAEPPGDLPLLAEANVICTPHLGASTSEAQIQVAVDIADQIGEFARGDPARNAINLPRISAADLRTLTPYIDLAQRMGSFLGQLSDGSLAHVEVKLAGEIATSPVIPVTSAAVAGALQQAFDQVNLVNARFLAEDRGIRISESTSTSTGLAYASTVEIAIESSKGVRHSVVGTLFGDGEARFVEVDGISLEAIPEGVVLVVANRDEPGVIGHIGTILGEVGINISRMHLGLAGGQALSLISVDKPVPDATLAKLSTRALAVTQVTL